MEKSAKAALISAVVLPGAGHIYLKVYFTAAVLAGTALVALYILISNAVEKALLITDKILAGEVRPDIAVISELVSKQSIGDDAQLIGLATTGLITAWLVGILDSYRVGRAQENPVGTSD